MSTPIDLFGQHMEWLVDNGYRTLTLDDLAARIDGAPSSAANEIVITFDDGYSCLKTAVPVLDAADFSAASFLITALVGSDGYLSWDEARRLADTGTIEFHSHSHSHHRWPMGAATAATVTDDITTSRLLLSTNLDRPLDAFTRMAWPYGRTCPEWDQAARDAGVDTTFVVQRGAVTQLGRHDRLSRLMVDGMPLPTFSRMVQALTNRAGATAFNVTFGTVRRLRRYRSPV